MDETQGMSEVFSHGLDSKLGDDLAANGGGIVTGMIGLVSYVDSDGDNNWALIAGPSQSILVSMGMVDAIGMLVDRQACNLLGLDDV